MIKNETTKQVLLNTRIPSATKCGAIVMCATSASNEKQNVAQLYKFVGFLWM